MHNNIKTKYFSITISKIFICFLLIISSCIAMKKEKPQIQEAEEKEQKPVVDTEYYSLVEKPAQFNGGDINNFKIYLKSNIKYPVTALKKRQQGTVVVQFGVNWDGEVEVFSILKSSGYKVLDEEAVRAIKQSPKWIPAQNQNVRVGQLYIIQVSFNVRTRKIEIK